MEWLEGVGDWVFGGDPEPPVPTPPPAPSPPQRSNSIRNPELLSFSPGHGSQAPSAQSAIKDISGKSEEDWIAELDPAHYRADFDPVGVLLRSLPPDPWPAMFMENKLAELDSIKAILDKRLSQAVQDHYEEFVTGMNHIQDIKLDLAHAEVMGGQGRKSLQRAHLNLCQNSFDIMRKHRRKSRLLLVERTVKQMKEAMRLDQDTAEYIRNRQYLEAVQTAQACKALARTLSELQCMSGIRRHVREHEDELRQRLVSDFEGVCTEWEPDRFVSTFHAMLLLGLGEMLGVELRDFFLTAMDKGVAKEILACMPRDAQGGEGKKLEELRFRELCTRIPSESFLGSYLAVCSRLAAVLRSAASMAAALPLFQAQAEKFIPALPPEAHTWLPKACQELELLGPLLWERVQLKLSGLLSSRSLTVETVVIDEFLRILKAGYRLIAVGEFCSRSKSQGLRSSLLRKSKEYVANFHRDSFKHLRAQLESEIWVILPLDEDFTIQDIKELRLKPTAQAGKTNGEANELPRETPDRKNIIQRFMAGDNLFYDETADERPAGPVDNEAVQPIDQKKQKVAKTRAKLLQLRLQRQRAKMRRDPDQPPLPLIR
eukprot:g72968.t1